MELNKKHVDGIWHTSEFNYLDTVIMIKSRKGTGIKAHCFLGGKVLFTEHWNFMLPEKLLERMKVKVDKYKSGEWIPAKLKNKSPLQPTKID